MKRLRVDLAPRSLSRTVWHVRPVSWLLWGASTVLCATAVPVVFDLLQQKQMQEAELQRYQSARKAYASPAPAPATMRFSAVQTKAISDTIGRLNLPWGDLFNAVEEVTPDTIALLSLEFDARSRRLRGIAEARNSNDMLAYIGEMTHHGPFQSVVLIKHETNEQDLNKPLRFQFEAIWAGGQNEKT